MLSMKKIIYGLFTALTLLFVACEEDLPKASWDLHEVSNLTATPLDASMKLSWTAPDEVQPTGYYISWSSEALETTGGNMCIEDASQCSVLIAQIRLLIHSMYKPFTAGNVLDGYPRPLHRFLP